MLQLQTPFASTGGPSGRAEGAPSRPAPRRGAPGSVSLSPGPGGIGREDVDRRHEEREDRVLIIPLTSMMPIEFRATAPGRAQTSGREGPITVRQSS